ncbi:Cytochrome c peroxidase [Prosthecobacter debontii]|uniref:Cytochrome c peroxidase n=1 Tax=Prosthecobacter debontii TaxID=48467 RepID=A0A1T4XGJ0_9BACT|nr:MbnP family protein [Prosthecobacter debontii]SKA88517.1 Cytochrome c peroxidase [Prosthecobacter debontii]
MMFQALRYLLALGGLSLGVLHAQVMHLEIQPEPLIQGVADSHMESLERLDFLVSGLALQHVDGSWLESRDWFAYYSLGQKRFVAQADGIPASRFKAVRFVVGVPEPQDKADPNLLPPDHPLHPNVCGLHWGWQGGYVYMAIEGRWRQPGKELSGYSFHLAKSPNTVPVEIPVDFQGGGPVTIKLQLDSAQILQGIDLANEGHSTHSRSGDPLVPKLRANISKAFSLESVRYDLYQPTENMSAHDALPAPTSTHPLPLKISRRLPQVQLPSDNPITQEGVSLGEKLFHDPRLSINNTQSCASCHDRSLAFSDSRPVSLGAEGQQGTRQAMPLFNLAWSSSFFWDGRANSLREQVLLPIQDKHEMNESLDRVPAKIADLKDDFAGAFDSEEITSEKIAKALEQFLLTLVSQDSRFDQAARKVALMTEEEKRGLQLFVTEFDPARGLRGADCFHCHGGTLFTDHQFKNNGLDLTPADVGRMRVSGNPADKGKFKTPGLRNIARTAPYMHDGRFQTLEEVVEHYNSGVQRSETLDPNLAKHPVEGLRLTDDEKRALVAFLKTLTDEEFVSPPAKPKIVHTP